jgi:hypothetical protein
MASFLLQNFLILSIFLKKDEEQLKTKQKMFAMAENYFAIAFLLLFHLFRYYWGLFWIALFGHNISKLLYNLKKAIFEKGLWTRTTFVLIIFGEISRYIFYLFLFLWCSETKLRQITKDEEYGKWLFHALLAELSFHLFAIVFSIVADFKDKSKLKKKNKSKISKKIKGIAGQLGNDGEGKKGAIIRKSRRYIDKNSSDDVNSLKIGKIKRTNGALKVGKSGQLGNRVSMMRKLEQRNEKKLNFLSRKSRRESIRRNNILKASQEGRRGSKFRKAGKGLLE